MKSEKQPTKTKYKDVTSADVKACKGYEDISEELAKKIADAILVYTVIIYTALKTESLKKGKRKSYL